MLYRGIIKYDDKLQIFAAQYNDTVQQTFLTALTL